MGTLPTVGYHGQPDEPKVVTMQTMNVRENLYVLSGDGENADTTHTHTTATARPTTLSFLDALI